MLRAILNQRLAVAALSPPIFACALVYPKAMPEPQRIKVCVGPARDQAGFVDTSKGVNDSIKDVQKKLAWERGLLVDCGDSADVRLIIGSRGEGSESLGYAGRITVEGAGFAERREVGMWVSAGIYVRDGAQYTLTKQLLGTHGYEASSPVNPYASLASIGGWRECAKKIAEDAVAWIDANRGELIARRPH